MNKILENKLNKWFTDDEIKILKNIDSRITIPNRLTQKELNTLLNIQNIHKYKYAEIEQIIFGIQNDIDVNVYSKPEFSFLQMQQIRWGLEAGLDVSIYAKSEFNGKQMELIRFGLEKGINLIRYAKHPFNWSQKSFEIYELRIGLVQGLDVSIYAKPELDWNQMRKVRVCLMGKLKKKLKEPK